MGSRCSMFGDIHSVLSTIFCLSVIHIMAIVSPVLIRIKALDFPFSQRVILE